MSNFVVQRKMCDPVVECRDPSLTSQADLKDTQISSILRRYNATGVFPTNNRPVLTGTEYPSDFTDACNSFTKEKFENERRLVENSDGSESRVADDNVSVHTEQAADAGKSADAGKAGSEEVK